MFQFIFIIVSVSGMLFLLFAKRQFDFFTIGFFQLVFIFCLSSGWGETFPNVLGETTATAVPCVATDVGDSAIIIGKTGIVVPPRDEEALANGIEDLLTMSLDQRLILSASARVRIEANYTLEAIVEQYAALYEKLI